MTMAGYDHAFTADVARWLSKAFGQFRLISHDARVFEHPEVRATLEFSFIGGSLSWTCDSLDRVPPITDGEEYRRQGLGSSLAAMYARAMLETGRIPYYSGATEISGQAAQRAGYFVCRELTCSDLKSRR